VVLTCGRTGKLGLIRRTRAEISNDGQGSLRARPAV